MLTTALLLTAALFGTMLFFSFFMAPLIFTKLEADTAGRFIRAVFPWYYVVLLVLAAAAGTLLLWVDPRSATLLLVSAGLALLARQVLMPTINACRDRALAGDTRAEGRFNRLHRLSVVINFVQLAGVTAVLVLLARV